MAFQISEATRLPYVTVERMEGFRNYVQYRLSSVLNRFATRASGSLKTIGCITYVLFFAWQVIGLILYAIRAFETSISAKRATFQQTHIKLFNHSANLELIWLVTWLLNTALVMIALSKQGHPTNLFLTLSVPQRNLAGWQKYRRFDELGGKFIIDRGFSWELLTFSSISTRTGCRNSED